MRDWGRRARWASEIGQLVGQAGYTGKRVGRGVDDRGGQAE